MWQTFVTYWPLILVIIPMLMAAIGIVHAIMTKEDVRAATGWVGVMILSPFLGAIIYAIAGINRIRRATISAMRPVAGETETAKHDRDIALEALISAEFGQRFELRRAPRGEHKRMAVIGKHVGERRADTGGGAGDQCDGFRIRHDVRDRKTSRSPLAGSAST